MASIFMVTKRFSGIIPAATSYTFRRYYKRDFHF
jgi:hypothetical protein